jgi:hypothetical protein
MLLGLGVLRLLLRLALLLRLLVLLLACPVRVRVAGTGAAGPEPHRCEVGATRQVNGSTPAAFDLTVQVIIPAGRDALINALV